MSTLNSFKTSTLYREWEKKSILFRNVSKAKSIIKSTSMKANFQKIASLKADPFITKLLLFVSTSLVEFYYR